jgi:hypothetical protein
MKKFQNIELLLKKREKERLFDAKAWTLLTSNINLFEEIVGLIRGSLLNFTINDIKAIE